MKVKCEDLTTTIMECFDNSIDDRFTPEERRDFLVKGKQLRGYLVNLLSAKFDDASKEITEANQKIEEVNIKLKEKYQLLHNVSGVIGEIGELTSVLDDLLKVASSVV